MVPRRVDEVSDFGGEEDENKLEESKAEFKPVAKLMEEFFGVKFEKLIVSALTTSECAWSTNAEHTIKSAGISRRFHDFARRFQEDDGGESGAPRS